MDADSKKSKENGDLIANVNSTNIKNIQSCSKEQLEIIKLNEEIISIKITRKTNIISAIVTVLNLSVLIASAAILYMYVQRPAVDVARSDSERKIKMEIIKLIIDSKKSSRPGDVDEVVGIINNYFPDIAEQNVFMQIKNGKEKKNIIGIEYKNRCDVKELNNSIEAIDKLIYQLKSALTKEEYAVDRPQNSNGHGPSWLKIKSEIVKNESIKREIQRFFEIDCQ